MFATPIAAVRFTDGRRRLVCVDNGRQFVVGDDGTPVYGTWVLLPDHDHAADRPLIVEVPPR